MIRKEERVWARLAPATAQKLQRLVELTGTTPSDVIRRLIDNAEPADLVPCALREAMEARRVVTEQVHEAQREGK